MSTRPDCLDILVGFADKEVWPLPGKPGLRTQDWFFEAHTR